MNLTSFVDENKEIIKFVSDWRCTDDISHQLHHFKPGDKPYLDYHPETKYVGTLDYATARFNTILLRLSEHPSIIDEYSTDILECQNIIQHFYKNTKRLTTWPKILHPIIRWNLHGIGTIRIPKIKKLLDEVLTKIDGTN
jgi:hypothetical protein